jgi:hypothetical protein
MTCGRYVRVWTPLSEDMLMVDDAEGHALSIEVLSRGTREQLFLSLRLALAADYGARGQSFPLVLDDLLVNFDTERARATAEVLKDFALENHQVLLFTCHEHIKRLFHELRVPVRRLPDNSDSPAIATYEEPWTAPQPVTPAALGPTPSLPAIDLPVVAGEAGVFRGWPVDEDVAEDLVTIEDQSSFWALVAHTRPWTANGAEEFAGEFAERVVEELRAPVGWDRVTVSGAARSRTGRRRRPAGTRAADVRPRNGRPSSTRVETRGEDISAELTDADWIDENDSEAA